MDGEEAGRATLDILTQLESCGAARVLPEEGALAALCLEGAPPPLKQSPQDCGAELRRVCLRLPFLSRGRLQR